MSTIPSHKYAIILSKHIQFELFEREILKLPSKISAHLNQMDAKEKNCCINVHGAVGGMREELGFVIRRLVRLNRPRRLIPRVHTLAWPLTSRICVCACVCILEPKYV